MSLISRLSCSIMVVSSNYLKYFKYQRGSHTYCHTFRTRTVDEAAAVIRQTCVASEGILKTAMSVRSSEPLRTPRLYRSKFVDARFQTLRTLRIRGKIICRGKIRRVPTATVHSFTNDVRVSIHPHDPD